MVHSPVAGQPGIRHITIDAVLSHFTESLTAFDDYSYATSLGIWSGEGLLICLIWGVISHQSQMREKALSAR